MPARLWMPVLTCAVLGLAPGHSQAQQQPSAPEIALPAALIWIARVQDPETGAWSLAGVGAQSYADGSRRENRCQATALALLSLQGAGQTPEQGKYQQAVAKGQKFLRGQQQADGAVADADRHELLLTHAQAMLAMCELYGRTNDVALAEPVKKALQFALAQQHGSGGWGRTVLTPTGTAIEPDMEVTAWMSLSLHSARLAGLKIPNGVPAKVGGFLDKLAAKDGSRYRKSLDAQSPTDAATAQGLLLRQLQGWRMDDPRLVAGAQYLLTRLPSDRESDAEFWYFATQVGHQMGTEFSTTWNSGMREFILHAQTREGRDAGSWYLMPKPDRLAGRGRLYVTCLCAHAQEVYYRHLPIYGKFAE